jgi:hypothetical protein
VAFLNQDREVAAVRPGTVVQLFGSAAGLFLGQWDDRPMHRFMAPLSPLYHTTRLPEVRIGRLQAKVLLRRQAGCRSAFVTAARNSPRSISKCSRERVRQTPS